MKKTLLLSLVVFSLLTVPCLVPVLGEEEGQQGYRTIPQEGQLIPTIQVVGNWLFSLLMAAAAISIVIAAFMFVFSGGDADKVATARQWVIYALVGVILALLSAVLINWAASMVV